MGFFSDAVGYVKSFYNSGKEAIQSVYAPVKSIVNTIAGGADTINGWLEKAKEIPVLRDVVNDTIGELWNPAYSLIRDARDVTNMAGEYGSMVDQAVSGALNSAGSLG